MILSLKNRLILAFLLPSILIFGAIGLWADELASKNFEREFAKRLIAIGQAVQSRFQSAYYSAPDFWTKRLNAQHRRMLASIQDRIQRMRAATGVRRIFIFRPNGQAIADTSERTHFGDRLYEVALDRVEWSHLLQGQSQGIASSLYCAAPEEKRANEAKASILTCPEGKLPFKTAYVPIKDFEGEVQAIIGIEGNAGQLQGLYDLRKGMALLALLGALAIVGISLTVSRKMVKPIRDLVMAAQSIGQGNLDKPIVQTRRDELGELEMALEKMRQDLFEHEQQLQMMLSGVAHEIRNPLGGIHLFLGLLKEDLEDQGMSQTEIFEHVEKIQREMDYLTRVVKEFLEYARHRELDLKRFSALDFLHEVIQLIDEGRDIQIEITPEDLEFSGDRDKLKGALINVLRNALQASEQSIEVKAYRQEGENVLWVKDRGEGMSPEVLKEVLKPFFTTREKGTGLGLARVHQIIQAHGGSIEILSEPSQGTEVFLKWPHRELPKEEIPEGWLG